MEKVLYYCNIINTLDNTPPFGLSYLNISTAPPDVGRLASTYE